MPQKCTQCNTYFDKSLKENLDKWHIDLEQNKFDLILMDLEMPEMDGIETTSNIRNSKKDFADLPIVFLSANKFNNEKEIRDKYGVNNFITKPYNLVDISKAINSYIVLNKTMDEL